MNTLFGRTVSGELVFHNEHQVPQKPQKSAAEFLPLLDAVLSQPGIHSVRWTQYTPYFNDGNPCTFGIHEVCVKFIDNPTDGYLTNYSMYDYLGGRVPTILDEYESLQPVLKNLDKQTVHFEDFCYKTFGDHAQITATTTEFNVEFYRHD